MSSRVRSGLFRNDRLPPGTPVRAGPKSPRPTSLPAAQRECGDPGRAGRRRAGWDELGGTPGDGPAAKWTFTTQLRRDSNLPAYTFSREELTPWFGADGTPRSTMDERGPQRYVAATVSGRKAPPMPIHRTRRSLVSAVTLLVPVACGAGGVERTSGAATGGAGGSLSTGGGLASGSAPSSSGGAPAATGGADPGAGVAGSSGGVPGVAGQPAGTGGALAQPPGTSAEAAAPVTVSTTADGGNKTPAPVPDQWGGRARSVGHTVTPAPDGRTYVGT
jgi:hypothetical protein